MPATHYLEQDSATAEWHFSAEPEWHKQFGTAYSAWDGAGCAGTDATCGRRRVGWRESVGYVAERAVLYRLDLVTQAQIRSGFGSQAANLRLQGY